MNRVNAGQLIGEKKHKDAKYLLWFYLSITFIMGIIIFFVLLFLRQYVAKIYTLLPEVSDILQNLLLIYGVCCITEFSNGSLSCLMRLADHVTILSFTTFGFFVILQGPLSYVFCFILD